MNVFENKDKGITENLLLWEVLSNKFQIAL